MTEGDDERVCSFTLSLLVLCWVCFLQVRWSLHTLFYLLCNNELSQQVARDNPGFEAKMIANTLPLLRIMSSV